MQAIIGKKLGMTRIFNEKNEVIPVTVVEVAPCLVLQIKTKAKDGYDAISIGGMGPVKGYRTSKSLMGLFKKVKCEPLRVIREVRVSDVSKYEVGQKIGVEMFEGIKKVHIRGRTKGRGTTGTVKRYGFTLGPGTHGNKNHRKPGAIGAHTFPARVIPGKRMYGRYGDENCTMRNLSVVKIDKEKNVLIIKGCVPGPSSMLLYIRKA